jgi:glucose/arabinose dehydrogenase
MSNSLCTSSPLVNAVLAPGFCAGTLPVSVDQPRSIRNVKVPIDVVVQQPPTAQAEAQADTTSGNTTTNKRTGTVDVLLVLERGSSSVIVLEEGEDGVWSRRSIVSTGGLNHGLEFTTGMGDYEDHYLYASSSTTVFRWKINLENNTLTATALPERVIVNMNADGQGGAPSGHRTRTLAYDVPNNRLYVSVGSGGNVDPNSFRSRIRRFDLSNVTLPLDFVMGFVFADGLRNEVGLAFDRHGVLWGVENSADRLSRSDLGGSALTENNPAEELNRFSVDDTTVGSHYGYPYCWTAYRLPDDATANIPSDSSSPTGRGTVWAWPSFLADGVISDDTCRSTEAYVPPAVAMQAHSAPLGITFYQWTDPETRPHHCANVIAFPVAMDGFAFMAFHGSWNRKVPNGYKVVYVPMDENGNVIQSDDDNNDGLDYYPVVDLLAHASNTAQWEDGFRPVDVEFDSCGRLLVSSDGSRRNGVFEGSKIVRIESTSVNFTKVNTPIDTDLPDSGSGASFRSVSSQSVLVNLLLAFILGLRMLQFR